MGECFIYIIKCSIFLTSFYLFNRLLLAKETFHKLNRLLWLAIIPISVLLPILNIPLWEYLEQYNGQNLDNLINQTQIAGLNNIATNHSQDMQESVSLSQFVEGLLLIYSLGLVILFIIKVTQYILIVSKIVNNKKTEAYMNACSDEQLHIQLKEILTNNSNKPRVIYLKDGQAPFSWMNCIFISVSDIKENGQEIINHELAHLNLHHSIDILLADLLITMQWFNPSAWLLKQSLMQVHEYQADELVISRGINIKNYQLLLIKKAVGQRLYSMTNSLNHSKLKNRITMMLKEKSSKWAYAKCLYALPLMLAVVSAFGAPGISNKMNEIESKCSNIFLENPLPDNSNKLGTRNDVSNLKHDSTKVEINCEKISSKTKAVIVCDEKVISSKDLNKIKSDNIGSVIVFKNKPIDDKFSSFLGDKMALAKENGLILIITKNSKSSDFYKGLFKNTKHSDKDRVCSTTVTMFRNGDSLAVKSKENVDKKIYVYNMAIDSLNGNNQKMVVNVKDSEAATVIIKNVIMINDKSKNQNLIDGDPIYVIDGKIYEKKDINLKNIYAENISSVTVIKGDSAVKLYGDKAKNGVIEIKLKPKK